MKKREVKEIRKWKKEFAARLDGRMSALDIDIPTLAKISKISHTSIRRYLDPKNTTIPTALTIKKLAKALSVNSAWLIDFSIIHAPLP